MTIEGDVPYTGIYKMYHIPAHTEEEYYIADILTDLLANGKSSLLFQNMVKKAQVSPQVNAFSWGFHDPGAISIDGKVADGKTIKEFEDSLLETIEQLQSLTNEDLDRIKNKLESTFVMQKLTILNKAMGLAFSDTLGDIELVNKTTDIYRNISLDQVKTAAEKFLAPENSSTLYYLPKSN